MTRRVSKSASSPNAARITILIHDARWKGLKPTVQHAAAAALSEQKIKDSAVVIVLANDTEVQILNNAYRGKNKPTNVLSFPNDVVEKRIRQLGDIILSYDRVAEETTAQNKPFKHHLTHLVIHGVLHLLGLDHENEIDANIMEAYEIAILARMGIANPYESA